MPQESPPPPSCDETSKQQISRIARRKGVVSSGPCSTPTNSLDWDSPSTKTGTVKRRPVSGSGSSSSGTYKLSDCDCDSGIASPLSPVSFAGSGCFISSRVDSSKSSKIRQQVSDIEPFVRCKSPECVDSKTEMANGNRFGWNKGARPKPARGLNGNVLSGGADNGTRSEQERSRQNDASRYLNGNQIDYEPYTPGYSSYLPPCNSELDIREKEENRMKRGNLLSFAKDLKGGLNIFSSEKRQHANRSPEKSPEKRHSTTGILERKSNINGIGERRQLVNLKVKYIQERDVGSLRGAHDDPTQNTFPGHERKTCPGSLLSFKKDVGASSTKESYKSKRDRIVDDTEDKPTGSLTNCSTETENGRSVRQTSFPASQEDDDDDGAGVFDRNCVWRCDGTERIVTDRSDDRGRSGDGVGARSRSSSGECVRSYVNGACCCDRCCGRTGLDYDCKMKMLRDGFWRELEKVRKTVRVVDSGSFEKIYTDWANHYLEKARSKRRVAALATDCSDGVLLADVIESVTNTKIPDINRKPKTPGQMLDNINSCVNALRAQQVAGIEAISASELRDGRLKAVLALFFALSRHKQQTKQQQRLQQHGSSIEMAPHNTDTHVQAASPQHRQISAGVKNPTSIPLPGSALPARRCPPDKVRPAPPSQNNTSTVVHQQPSSVASSRASSPAASMIPRGPANSHPITQIPSSPYHSPSQQNGQNKSMLDKLKLFKNQDRNNVGTPTPPVTSGKRTSSSSGVSSAKSERSDSSASLEPLNEVTKPVNRNARTNKTTRTSNSRPVQTKNTTNSNKKENSFVSSANKNVVKNEIGYGNRSVSVSKLTEPKIKLTSNNKPSVTPPVTHNEKSTTHANKNSGSHTEFNHAKQVPNNIISPLPTQPNSAQGTGIPKPTAAVKGTSKSVDEKNTSVVQPLKHSSSNHWNPVSRENSFAGTPTTTTTTTSPKPNQAVAMVSPMPSESQSSQLSESSHSGSHSASTGHHSNSSESSVIYKPSSESGSDHPASRSVIPNRKEPISFLNEEEELCNKSIDPETNGIDDTNIKPVENQTNSETNLELGQKSSEESPLQSNTIPKPLPNGVTGLIPSHNRDGSLGDEETAPMNVEPMLPLVSVRGYCNNLTLPSRTGARQQYIQRQVPADGSDYCEIGLSNGYMSDGEVLRSHPDNGFRIGDMYDGYMSDGRSAIGLRRLQHNSSHQNIYQQQFMGQGAPRVSPSLAVLTEQSRPQRGGRIAAPDGGEPGDDAPPPTGPRPSKQTRHRVAADPSSHHNNNSAQWKKYTDSPGVGSPVIVSQQTHVSGHNASPSSPTSSRRERRGSPHGQNKEKSSSSKVRVPQSFGYVKRNSVGSNGTSMPVGVGGGAINQVSNSKTAQVSAVPRTKVKVSGGTQTCSSDLQPHQPSHHKSNPQYKSYSLTGNTASQLSQSVRERLMMGSQSLPKAAVSGHATHEYGLVMRQSRPKASDGSLSDTQAIENTSPYAPWLRHSNTYSIAPRLAETDSMESLSSLPGHRGSLTHSRLLRDSSARLSRSNSIRSTKSEKLYPSMLHRGPESEPEPYYCLPVGAIGVNPHGAGGIVAQHWSQPTSPAPAGSGSPRLFPLSPTHGTLRHGLPKNDDVHGSSVSLVSTASSIYSSAEEKQAHEIRKLRRELVDAQEKVHTLTSQLSTNAHVVSAFEQSLSSMTQRLQYLTATAEKKDSELAELRQAMESLRAQSVQAGLTSGLARQPSSDSVSSLSSACSLDKQDKKKKKGWLRSSFTKAFSRNAKQTKIQSMSEGETGTEHRPSMESKSSQIHADGSVEVEELQKQLREKDLVLTDIRLEALSSAHQLESLKDTVMKMRNEMLSLKQNNERLQRMVAGTISQDDEHDSISEPPPDVIAIDDTSIEPEPDGKKISISVYLGRPQTFEKYYMEHFGPDGGQNAPEGREIVIAFRNVGASTSWGQLDSAVRRSFEKHVTRLDPNGALGLGGDSIAKYRLGEAERAPDAPPPDLLPVGYAIGRVSTLHIVLRPVCALAFEALIPRGVAQRLVSLLSEHGRLVLCGPPGTGKTHLAQRLADFHAQSQGRDPGDAVATFNVDHKSVKELRQYLTHLGDRASAGDSSVLPCVVVLDNLHRAGPLSEALGTLPRALPCLIGTMAQAACSATSLQLQHGFRWVLVAPHMEPASGLLGRVLRRRLATLELIHGDRPELAAVVGWLPRVWRHLNKFLETHSSSDVAIGPRLFLACPLDLDAAKAWFSDVWNYSLAPYLREAAREGLQLYGKRAAWVDPCQFVFETYPWPGTPPQNLVRIGPEDVGLEAGSTTQSDRDADPLLNMLMRLQEAANYSSPHSNDSDCASLDSNLTHESSLGTESVL